MPPEPILTFDKTRRTNAELLVACRDLGYLSDDMAILDVTYGKGRFWKLWEPRGLVKNDLYVGNHYHEDYRSLPFTWVEAFDAVVFDPEYKLNGTSTGKGAAALDPDYGVAGKYRPVAERTEGWLAGFYECARVCQPGGHVLVKIMDQVVSGERRFLTKELWLSTRVSRALNQVDELYLYGVRKQPERTRKCKACKGTGKIFWPSPAKWGDCDNCGATGRVESPQQHAQQSLSTLMVFRKGRRATRMGRKRDTGRA